MISEPGAPFLETWLRSYLEFRHDLYEYNGIIKPWVSLRTTLRDCRSHGEAEDDG